MIKIKRVSLFRISKLLGSYKINQIRKKEKELKLVQIILISSYN